MAGEDTGRCESRREVCLGQSHGRQGGHLWHALTAETVQVREAPAQEGAHVGHLCLSFPFGLRVLPLFTARSLVTSRWSVLLKKKDRIALEAHILTIADFCPNSEDSYAVALFLLRMSVIGSLIFCTDCGNLLRESTGNANAILHCNVCGTRNKGMRLE